MDVYLTGTRKMAEVSANLEFAEAAHGWALFLTVPFLAMAFAERRWSGFAVLALFDVLINVYPALHLRVARSRLELILRMASKPNNLPQPAPPAGRG